MTETPVRPGPTNSLVDVAGLRVGHATRIGDGWLSGTTVVLAPDAGAVAGVDVRGGGPGTRETDLLDPRNLVERVHAVVLSGGSAFGLAAADGVMQGLFGDGIGFPMGGPGEVVPIVPGAVIFDLGRGGDFAKRPDAACGAEAYAAAAAPAARTPGVLGLPLGCVGAGTGARAGGLKGGIGSASAVLADGATVAALVVVNAVGSCVEPSTGELYAARFLLAQDLPVGVAALQRPDPAELADAAGRGAAESAAAPLRYPLATTIGVIATDLELTKAQCAKVAGIGHDGLARAIRPVHTLFDGDTLFTLGTGQRPGAVDPFAMHAVLAAAGDVVTRAVARAMLAATTVTTAAGTIRSYRDAFPSALARSGAH